MDKKIRSLILVVSIFVAVILINCSITAWASDTVNQVIQFEDTKSFSSNSGNKISNDIFKGYSGSGYVYLASGWAETKFNIKEAGKYKITIVSNSDQFKVNWLYLDNSSAGKLYTSPYIWSKTEYVGDLSAGNHKLGVSSYWGYVALDYVSIEKIDSPQTPSSAPEDTSVIRGVNVPAAWYDSQSYSALDTIKNQTFNAVRIVWETKGLASRLDEYLTKCDNLNLKPIVELHDATGGMDTTSLNKCLDYWLRSDVMNVIKKHPKTWLNIANEWGPENSTVWRDGYKDAVSKLRSAGFVGTIVIDSGGWGQDSEDILKYAKDIYNVNSNKNVVFSIHMYGSWNDNKKMDSFLNSCKSNGIPIIIGEFGYNSNNGNNNLGCKVDVAHLISYCKANKVGFLAWSWTGNDSANAWLDMTSDWVNYTWWGKYVHDNMW